MEKKIMIAIYAIACSMLHMMAQENILQNKHYRKGGFVMQGNIAPTYYIQQNSFQSNFHGSLEYFITHNFAIHGRTFIALPMQFESDVYLKNSYQLLNGVTYHPLNKSKIDPYIGGEWGIGLVNVNDQRIASTTDHLTYLYSFFAGAKVYMGNRFHLFAQVNYVDGIIDKSPSNLSLKELKLSFGLGLQFFKKEKKKV